MITSLLKRAYSMDVELWTEDGKLRYKAPEGVFAEMKQAVVDNKEALIQRLEQNEAAKLELWAVFEFGEMYSKQLNPGSHACIFRNESDMFTLWRGSWKLGESRPIWEKTIITNASLRTAFDRASRATNTPRKGGDKQWSR